MAYGGGGSPILEFTLLSNFDVAFAGYASVGRDHILSSSGRMCLGRGWRCEDHTLKHVFQENLCSELGQDVGRKITGHRTGPLNGNPSTTRRVLRRRIGRAAEVRHSCIRMSKFEQPRRKDVSIAPL